LKQWCEGKSAGCSQDFVGGFGPADRHLWPIHPEHVVMMVVILLASWWLALAWMGAT
jgi:hypothetical protein